VEDIEGIYRSVTGYRVENKKGRTIYPGRQSRDQWVIHFVGRQRTTAGGGKKNEGGIPTPIIKAGKHRKFRERRKKGRTMVERHAVKGGGESEAKI